MDDRMMELIRGMAPTLLERLMGDQKRARDFSEPRTIPEQNSKAIPPSKKPMGMYKGNMYG